MKWKIKAQSVMTRRYDVFKGGPQSLVAMQIRSELTVTSAQRLPLPWWPSLWVTSTCC